MGARMFAGGLVRRFRVLFWGLLFSIFTAQCAQAAPVVVSVDHRVTVSYSKPQFDARKGILTVQARIKNRSEAALLSPLQLSFDQTTLKNLRIQNAQGIGKDGRPYFDIKLPKGLLLAKASSDAIKVVIAVERKDQGAKHGYDKTALAILNRAQRVSAGVEMAFLNLSATPYALAANTGKQSVRFSVPVRLSSAKKRPVNVYVRLKGGKQHFVMNDLGKNGDFAAKDGIFGVNVEIDTNKYKADSCLLFEAFTNEGRYESVSSSLPLCVSSFPVRTAVPNTSKPAVFPNGMKAVADEILLFAKPSTSAAAIRELAHSINASVVGSILPLNLYQLRLPAPTNSGRLTEIVARLSGLPGVTGVSVNAIGAPAGHVTDVTDPEFANQHGVKLVAKHPTSANTYIWDANAIGSGVTIVVADEGLDRTHPEFGTPGSCQVTNNECGPAALNNDNSTPGSAQWHGTRVAGVIVSKALNSQGIAGVAHGGIVHSYKVASYALSEMDTIFMDVAGYVASDGTASVINASFTGGPYTGAITAPAVAALCQAINTAVTSGFGAIVVNAAGNNNDNNFYYPARCNEHLNLLEANRGRLISVGNSASIVTRRCGNVGIDQRCQTDLDDATKLGSNYGSWVEIAAPGSDIRTTIPGGYAYATGTSFSAPIVSGAVAILKSCGVPLDSIQSTLTGSATVTVPYPGSIPATETPRLDIYRALQSQVPTAPNLSAAESYTENVPLNLADIVIASNLSGCATYTATLTLSDVAAGSLTTGTSGTVTSTFVGGVWTASGPMADVNALLAGVMFNPSPNYNSNFNIATSVTDGITTIAGSKAMTGIATNSVPTGSPTISGTPTENQTLTANTAAIADADGLGAFTYQWLRNGVNIGGATVSTYTLGDADVGQLISVRVSYTDGGGIVESLTSSQTAAVANVNDLPTGLPTISGVVTEDQMLTANTGAIADVDGLGAFGYQWTRNGVDILGQTGNTYTLGDADVGQAIRVRVTYTDGGGAFESLTSAPTAAVGNVNDVPTGLPTISGAVVENQTLTAGTAAIIDADGLGAFNHQWLRNGVNIGGATGSTYILGDADVGQTISVRVSYTDGGGNAETLTSNPTGAVGNVNDAPTGLPTITGTATEDQMLTANTGAIADVDGLGTFDHQWLRNGVNIGGATGSTYTLGDDDVGQSISVRVSYTDGGGTAESLTSNPTGAVGNVNDAPTGLPTITGTATEDQTLTANTGAIVDVDGLGTFDHQWLRNGVNIAGATLGTYTLGDADVGQTISVRVSYTDLGGNSESLTSISTAAVANVNDAPTGKPVIDPADVSGNRNQGQVLTALTTLIDDADGLGSFHYQWWRDTTAVGGDSVTYPLQDTDLGGHMKVCVSYTDTKGTLENGPTLCSDTDTTAVGDPHIFTVDGLRYDFQGAGEFVALRGAGGMEIQLRMEAVPTAPPLPDDYTGLTSGVSVNTAVAARVGKYRVTYQPDTSPNAAAGIFVLRVDGAVKALPAAGIDLGDGGRVLPLAGGGIQIDFPDRTTLMVNTSSWPFYGAQWLHVNVFHTPAYDGLMGARSKGSWLPRLSDGSAFGAKPASLSDRYVQLYEKFADSWRVNKDISLFDYVNDTSMEKYTNKKWPTEKGPYAVGNVPVAKPLPRKAAELACRDVAGKVEKANCVFDVRVMGHKDLAKGHVLNQKIRLGAVNVVVRPAGKLNAKGEMVVTATVARHAMVVPKVKGVRAVPAGAVQFMLGDKPLGKPVKLDAKGQAKLVVTRQNMERFNTGKLAITAQYLPSKVKGNVFLPSVSRKLTRELVKGK